MAYHYPLELTPFFYQSNLYLNLEEMESLIPFNSTLLPGFELVIKSKIPTFMLDLLAFQFLMELPLTYNQIMMSNFLEFIYTPSAYGNFSDAIADKLGIPRILSPFAESSTTSSFFTDPKSPDSEFENMGPEFAYLETEIRRRHLKYPHLTKAEIVEIMFGMGSDSTEMALRLFDDLDNMPIDYSNLYNHNGTILDVTQLSVSEVLKLATTVDDIDTFESLEHIRSVYMASAPTVKLYYPEPFIASPSFIHNDLAFLHILQYQY
jgi:hypothetical protein